PVEALPSDIDVSARIFEQHLKWLSRRREQVVDLYSLLARSAETGFYSITFDDGFRDNLTVALPLIEKYALPMTVFAVAGFIGKKGYLSKTELRTLADHPLVTVGSHGMTHKHLSRMARDDVRNEMSDSKSFLEEVTGKRIDLLAYPFGDCDGFTEEAAEECGYTAAWSVWNGTNSRYSMWRIPLGRHDNLVRFRAKASAAYFPVKRFLKPPEVLA
ncbi:MAG: polysaccharide deacetylase family protein, partial [Acidobacteriota bacterium]|nr:polysaccharide deacetylase family protein [Acidobacteriota bacterium]